MKHIKFPSIEQFRNVVKDITSSSRYVGYDEVEHKDIFDESLPLPTITFNGTVKLHGTNAGITYSEESGLYMQNRERIITIEKDNAGFAFFMESRKPIVENMIKEIIDTHNKTEGYITIFGEFCGGSIQKGTSLNSLPKMFVIFGLTYKPYIEDSAIEWLDINLLKSIPELNIYNINDFQTYSIDIDFNNPRSALESLNALTLAVEEECPVGKALGSLGVGEGIVWSADYKGSKLSFKIKGEKHSKTKVKKIDTTNSKDEEKRIIFANHATPAWRLEQAWQNTFGINNEKMQPQMKELGTFLKLVQSDVIKEEMDMLLELDLEPKMVNRYISKIARDWFISQLDELSGI